MDSSSPLAAGPLAEALRRRRDSFNALFSQAQRAGARVDSAAFFHHLAAVVDPILRAIDTHFSERTDAAAVALYELSLELFTASLLGPQSRHPAVAETWQRLFPLIPRPLARDPRRLAASLSNAAHNLSQLPGARPAEWLQTMITIAPQCNDPDLLLNLGKVAAWRAGCPHYRHSTLEIARTLAPEFLAPLLFPNASTTAPAPPLAELPKILPILATHRWLTPAEALAGPNLNRIRIVQTAGDFRGFGGPFLRPPTVATQGPQLVASDGQFIWSLTADATGAVFHRLTPGTLTPNKQTGITRINNTGDIQWESASATFPQLANPLSIAFDGQTLALTLPDSHHIYLLARG